MQEISVLATSMLHGNAIPALEENSFSVVEFIKTLLKADAAISMGDQRTLLKPSRKLEIKRTLWSVYCEKSFAAVESAGACDSQTVEALLCVLLLSFYVTGDYRYLNTVLKVTSYGLDIPLYEKPSDQLMSLLESCLEAH